MTSVYLPTWLLHTPGVILLLHKKIFEHLGMYIRVYRVRLKFPIKVYFGYPMGSVTELHNIRAGSVCLV